MSTWRRWQVGGMNRAQWITQPRGPLGRMPRSHLRCGCCGSVIGAEHRCNKHPRFNSNDCQPQGDSSHLNPTLGVLNWLPPFLVTDSILSLYSLSFPGYFANAQCTTGKCPPPKAPRHKLHVHIHKRPLNPRCRLP